MNRVSAWLLLAAAAGLSLILAGCLDSRVIKNSPALQTNLEEPHSSVYFLRPDREKLMGVSDNAVTIEINGEKVLLLAKGEYALLRLKPTRGTVTVKTWSRVGGKISPEEVSGSETFNFAAGQTNFIQLKLFNEEFRGVYYVPERIEFSSARTIARDLRPMGEARKRPITGL